MRIRGGRRNSDFVNLLPSCSLAIVSPLFNSHPSASRFPRYACFVCVAPPGLGRSDRLYWAGSNICIGIITLPHRINVGPSSASIHSLGQASRSQPAGSHDPPTPIDKQIRDNRFRYLLMRRPSDETRRRRLKMMKRVNLVPPPSNGLTTNPSSLLDV